MLSPMSLFINWTLQVLRVWQAWGEDKTEVKEYRNVEDFFFLKIMNWLYFFQLFSDIFFNTGETGGKKDNASFKPLSASFWSRGGQGDDGDHDYDNKYENDCYGDMLTVIMMITMTMIMLIMTVMIKKVMDNLRWGDEGAEL